MTMPMGATGSVSGNKMTGNKIPKGYKAGQLQQFTPEQMQLFQQMFSHVNPQSFLSRLAGGEEGMFEQMEAPAMRQFQGLQGQLASRFSGMGMGGRRSSGFQNAANQATSDFAQQLQANRLGLQRQAIQDLQGLSSNLLGQRPYEQFMYEKPQAAWKGLLGTGATIAGGVGGAMLGGPMGAALGTQLGSSLGGAIAGSPTQANFSGIGKLPTKWS